MNGVVSVRGNLPTATSFQHHAIYIQPNAGFDRLGKTSPLHRKQSPESSILIQICIVRVSDGFSLNGSEARLVFHFFFQSIPPASRISFFFFFGSCSLEDGGCVAQFVQISEPTTSAHTSVRICVCLCVW